MGRWAALTTGKLGAVCALALLAEEAQAESRFETTPAPRKKADAKLDFTIVIPEVVYLGPAKPATGRDTPQPLKTKATDEVQSGEPFVVLTNGGTLAFAPTGFAQTRPLEFGNTGEAPEPSPIRVYLVAMP